MASAETVPAGLLMLQEEVPEKLVGYLPRVTCKGCKDNRCDNQSHRKAKCPKCNGWLTTAHIDLDYVGHAETTAQLLKADPGWTWEPLAFGDDGLPRFDDLGGLWIRLTVCGVTRLGYGTADNGGFKAKGDIRKEIIGDALRNAAMRFGWALNLWAKTDIHDRTPLEGESAGQPQYQVAEAVARKEQRERVDIAPRDRNPFDDEFDLPPTVSAMSDDEKNRLMARIAILCKEKRGIAGSTKEARQARLAVLSQILRHEVKSSKDLGRQQLNRVIDAMALEPLYAPPQPMVGEEMAQLAADFASAVEEAGTEPELAAVEATVDGSVAAGKLTPDQGNELLAAVGQKRGGWSHRVLAEQGAAL